MYAHPEYLIEADELALKLDDPSLRIFDTSVILAPQGKGKTYDVTSGYADFLNEHIKGAGFIDLADGWAEPHPTLRFTLPEVDKLREMIGQSGISSDHQVVLYSSGHLMWATRAWWLLYHAGHRNMAILNGNFTAWKKAGGATESGAFAYPETTFTADAGVTKFAGTDEVEAAMGSTVCTINSLSKSLYEGTGDLYYQRRGHIPGSHSLFYDLLLQDEYFLPHAELTAVLGEQGALQAPEVITYCGGGIAATVDAFACLLCGQEAVRVYDGSMSEWVQDANRPLTEGATP